MPTLQFAVVTSGIKITRYLKMQNINGYLMNMRIIGIIIEKNLMAVGKNILKRELIQVYIHQVLFTLFLKIL